MRTKLTNIGRNVTLRLEISHQYFFARRLFTRSDYTLRHRWMLSQHCFNLAQFNPETTNFYLVVDAAEIFNIATWQMPCQVAGTIEGGSWFVSESVWEEFLARQFFAV